MLLTLLRHADAGVPDPARWPGDTERPLTDLGRDVQRRMSETLRHAGFTLDALFTSPLLRARQTAQIVADVFGLMTIKLCEPLSQPPDIAKLRFCVGGGRSDQTVGLTGHSPWLDELASILLAGSATALKIDFPKSGAMAIRTDSLTPGAGQLVAFVTRELAV